MTEAQFYNTTPRTFQNILTGRRRKEEADYKDAWERTRLMVVASLMPHLGKGANKSIQKIWPLPWDGENGKVQKVIDPKEASKKAQEFWDKLDKKKNSDVEQSG